jgi:hypothetical protein
MYINFKGLELEVDYDYSEGYAGSYEYAPEPPYVQINEILWDGKDVYELIDACGRIRDIEEIIIDKL